MTDSAVDCSMPRLIRLIGPIGLTNAHSKCALMGHISEYLKCMKYDILSFKLCTALSYCLKCGS